MPLCGLHIIRIYHHKKKYVLLKRMWYCGVPNTNIISVASYSQAEWGFHRDPLTHHVRVHSPILKKIKAICFTYKFEPI